MNSDNQAVVMIDGKPHIELTAQSIVAPFSKDTEKLFVELKKYSAKELIELCKATQGSATVADEVTTYNAGNEERYVPFFLQHYQGFQLFTELESGQTTEVKFSKEQEDAFWAKNAMSIQAIVGHIMLSIRILPKTKAKSAEEALAAMTAAGSVINAEIKTAYVNGSVVPSEVSVPLSIRFSEESQQDRITYKRADNVREVDRSKAELRVPINWAALLLLFDNLIDSVEGALYKGSPCTSENKDGWVTLFPAWYKIAAIRHLFSESIRKN